MKTQKLALQQRLAERVVDEAGKAHRVVCLSDHVGLDLSQRLLYVRIK